MGAAVCNATVLRTKHTVCSTSGCDMIKPDSDHVLNKVVAGSGVPVLKGDLCDCFEQQLRSALWEDILLDCSEPS